MRFKTFNVLGLLVVLSLALAACGGAQQTQAFPGLVSDGELTFLAEGQFVRAVDVAAQQQRWQFPPAPEGMYGTFVSAPAVEDDLVVVASEGPAGSYSGAVFGLERSTGVRTWCLIFDNKAAQRLASLNCTMAKLPASRNLFGIGGAVDNRIIGGLTILDGQVYFGMANGRVYAVDAATGQDLWFVQAGRDVWSAPIATEDVVYFGSLDHHVYALDRASGRELWKKDVGAAVAGTPTLHEDRLYVGTFGSAVYALDAASGDEVWGAPFRAGNWVWDGPAVLDEVLYFTDVSGSLYAVEAATGQQRWVQRPGAAMRARPAVTETALYTGDRSSNLFALNPENGSTLWTKVLTGKGQILTTPLVLDDFVVVAPFSGSNKLEVYRSNGDFYWAFTPGN